MPSKLNKSENKKIDENIDPSKGKQDDAFSWLFLDSEKNFDILGENLSNGADLSTPFNVPVCSTNGSLIHQSMTKSMTQTVLPMGYPGYTPFPILPNTIPFVDKGSPKLNQEIEAESDSKKRKRAQNRENAKKSRQRKKERLSELEQRIVELEKENMEMKLQLQSSTEEKQKEREANQKRTERLIEMLDSNASAQDLAKAMSSFADRYADYGRDRRSSLKYHIDQLRKSMIPTQVTKMALWILQQDDSFYTSDDSHMVSDATAGSDTLWDILSKELKITTEQNKKLIEFRPFFQELAVEWEKCTKAVTNVEKLLESKNDKIEQGIEKLTSVITPHQAAKFIEWVTNNQACIHMLNKLWRT